MDKEDFYKTDKWLALRYQALRNNLGCCQACGARAGIDIQLHVDHIKPRSKYPELELVFTNLQVLCQNCNFGKSNKDQTNWHWVPSNELRFSTKINPEIKSKLKQLSWLIVNGNSPEIKRDAGVAYKALWNSTHLKSEGAR